jgi:hypothetical protein
MPAAGIKSTRVPRMGSSLRATLPKTHLRHTYMKLSPTSRSSAIKRATSLGIL